MAKAVLCGAEALHDPFVVTDEAMNVNGAQGVHAEDEAVAIYANYKIVRARLHSTLLGRGYVGPAAASNGKFEGKSTGTGKGKGKAFKTISLRTLW